MNYGIFNHLCAAPNPSVSIASIMDCCINYNGINSWKSIWVNIQSRCISARMEFKLHIWISNIAAANYWPDSNTNGIRSPNHAKLGVKLGKFDIKGALDVKYSIIWGKPDRGGLMGGATLQRSPTRIVRKVKSSSWWPRWQMMYNEKFWRYCHRSSPTTRADSYFFGWN